MKKKISLILLALLSVAIIFPTVASATAIEHGGMFDYDNPLISPRAAISVGGGKWNHGIGTKVWSQYDHGSKMHSATAKNSSTSKRIEATPGNTAFSSINSSLKGNQVYWSTF